jgi:hypothetical protein
LPFSELLDLGLDRDAIFASYGDAVPELWRMLQWWLDEKHKGGLGLSTIVPDTHFTRIGYADSQTLFVSSDRDKLTRFLGWLGLTPGEQISDDELLAYFRLWAARGEFELNLGTQMMLADESEHPRQLVAILRRAASEWEGLVRDEHGRTEARILIALRWAFPRPELSLVAERPPGFPATLTVHRGADEFELVSGDARDETDSEWYRVPLPISARALERGLKLESQARTLILRGGLVHVLHRQPELGCWASVDRLRPGEEAWLLVDGQVADRVQEFLQQHARRSGSDPEWNWVERAGVVPQGWRVARSVIVDSGLPGKADDLDPLRPRFHNRLSLQDGLSLPRGAGVYLTNGEPDLWLPDSDDLAGFKVTVDGLEFNASGPMVRLCERRLNEGPHEVALGTISCRFSTKRTSTNVTPPVDQPLGHGLLQGESGWLAQTLDAADCEGVDSGVVVTGATIYAPEDGSDSVSANGVHADHPVVLPVKAKSCILLGAVPGQIEWPEPPAKPPWMAIAGLGYRVFEYFPAFPVVWVLSEWNLKPRLRTRLGHHQQPAASADAGVGRVKVWANTVLEWQPPSDLAASALWEEYMDAAKDLLARE